MAETNSKDTENLFRKYELPVFAVVGFGLIALIGKFWAPKYTFSFSAYLALFMFLYMSRYLLDDKERTKAQATAIGSIIALLVVNAFQVFYLQEIIADDPIASLVNITLMGIFVSTVLYLFVLSRGLEIIENYGRRFSSKFKERNSHTFIYSVLLMVYMLSVGKYLFVLVLMKKFK